jgi:hypothetical protein
MARRRATKGRAEAPRVVDDGQDARRLAEMADLRRAREKQYRELAECRANSVAAKQIEKERDLDRWRRLPEIPCRR